LLKRSAGLARVAPFPGEAEPEFDGRIDVLVAEGRDTPSELSGPR
jgi:hypothetical protein